MNSPKPRVVVIDDGRDYARMVAEQLPELELLLPHGDGGPPCLEDGPQALAYFADPSVAVDVVLLDMHFDLPDARLLPLGEGQSPRRTRRFQGVAILRALRRLRPSLPVVLLTSHEDLSLIDADGELASQSMTYVLGREDLDTLRIRIHAALAEVSQTGEDDDLLWGHDRAMQAVRRRLQVLARGSLPVILEGETGTGKSLLAKACIHALSGRRGPFVTLDLAALPTDLIPAHLFGAVRGAYTGAVVDRKGAFELAHGGTLLIDEIHNVPAEVQKQLLVVLQDRRVRPLGSAQEVAVDVKVIAATTEPLAEAVASGRFRQDLYMRLSPATRVTLPPLRDRREDLPFFAARLVERAGAHPDNRALLAEVARAVGREPSAPLQLALGRAAAAEGAGLVLAVPEPAWKRLRAHPWPGNVRELTMVMHNLVTFTLVAAVDAISSGLPMHAGRLQVDPGLVGGLLQGAKAAAGREERDRRERISVAVRPGATLNSVANEVERQYLTELFNRSRGDFGQMAVQLLADAGKARAVRLRMNQLGLKVRELRQS